MVKNKIENLKKLPTIALKEMFARYYNQTSGTGNRDFFISRIAYKLQEAEYGGLSAGTKHLLKQIKEPVQNFSYSLSVGSQIIKDYKRTRHIININENNFEYDGQLYQSLSAVATAITGRRISGNFFFKLKQEQTNE